MEPQEAGTSKASTFRERDTIALSMPAKIGDLGSSQPPGNEERGDPNWVGRVEQVAGLGYWRLDVASRRFRASDGMRRLYGVEDGDITDLVSVMAALHPDDRENASRNLARAIEFGEDYIEQVRLRRPDASWRVLTNRSVCGRSETGAVTSVLGVVIDVTAMESALRISEARYRALIENGDDLVIESDLEGRITYMSPSAKKVTGYEPQDLVGRSIDELIDLEDRAAVASAFQKTVTQPGWRAGCVEYRVRHKEGHVLWLESCPCALLDSASGVAIGITDVIREITARKALEAAWLAKCEEAEAATRVKAEFLANVSHEIRTPLTAILGFSGLLQDYPDLPERAGDYVRRICTAGDQLMGLVNDVLDFSRLDAGKLELDLHAIDPAALVDKAVELLSELAAAKDLELKTFLDGEVPTLVSLDAGRVRQVLLNLIGNAIKFTSSGSITVALSSPKKNFLRITVADTGPGISPKLQERLFERFSQMDGSASRGHGGAGLGLAICKGLVEKMGGAVGVDTQLGRGSTFWFTVKAMAAAMPALTSERPSSEPAPPMHILVVDDVAVNRLLVRALLEPLGHNLEEADCGHEAVEAAMLRPFDLILMDLQMPGMGGLEATRIIRRTEGLNCDVPIVALSANVLAEQIADCYAAGMNGHVAKPIIPAALVAAITNCNEIRDDGRARDGQPPRFAA